MNELNNENTLTEKFIKKEEYPIWYYKELEKVEINYVIAHLLKETFVLDINGSKHEITFGYNKKEDFIGHSIKYDDITNSNLTSYNVIQKGFREGVWYAITEKDTTDEFKKDYEKRKEEYKRKDTENFYKKILSDMVKVHKDLNEEEKNVYLQKINNEWAFEELEHLINSLVNKIK